MSQEGRRGDAGARASARRGRSAGMERCSLFREGSAGKERLGRDLRGARASSRAEHIAALRAARALGQGAFRNEAPSETPAPTHLLAVRPLSPALDAPGGAERTFRREFAGSLKPGARGPQNGVGGEGASEEEALTSCRPDRLGIPNSSVSPSSGSVRPYLGISCALRFRHRSGAALGRQIP